MCIQHFFLEDLVL
uniref:Uncharacterized protein n=1 Tax=Anguilla anguilla TaxID=7936 RepID=A0A0E9QFV8_ANGAN